MRITKYKNIFSKSNTKNCSRETLVLKTNPWKYKSKELNGEKILGGYYKNELLLSTL